MVTGNLFDDFRAAQAKRLPLEQAANSRLDASGRFSQVSGPTGATPIQVTGRLRNGQSFYFRERFGLTEVELNGRVVSKVRSTSMMTPDQAATYVLNFLSTS